VLQALPPSAAILLHVDVDVIHRAEMPASYFPQPHGLTWTEAHDLVGELLGDPRLRLVEISEYAALRDLDQQWVGRLVGLLVDGLKPRAATPTQARDRGVAVPENQTPGSPPWRPSSTGPARQPEVSN
jgi:arginase family enzyme